MIRWRNWSLYLVSSKFEDSKGKCYVDAFFLLVYLCTPVAEAKRSHTSTSKKKHFLPQISGIYAKEETGVALSWLKQNEMIANPEKFHAILLRKNLICTS